MNITFNIIDGVPPYIVELNHGEQEYVYLTNGQKTISGLDPGDYIIGVTDAMECYREQTFSLTTTTTTTII